MIQNIALAIAYGIIGYGLAHAVLQAKGYDPLSDQILPPCYQEDDDNCYWDAQRMGNGDGWSFIVIDGTYIYFEHMERDEDAQ